VVPLVLDKVLLVICVEKVVCLLLLESGENGTKKISKGQRRFATVSALAASSVPALVLARGHRIENVNEIPLVVSNTDLDHIAKTKDAVEFLHKINAYEDIEKVKLSRKLRAGNGKSRNRRYIQRRGPLIVYLNENTRVPQAFRNIPGIELCNVNRLNLLQLAPGGHLGRFVIWAEDAFKSLENIFGSLSSPSTLKQGFVIPRAKMTNADLSRIINSDEVQSVLRPKEKQFRTTLKKKKSFEKFWCYGEIESICIDSKKKNNSC